MSKLKKILAALLVVSMMCSPMVLFASQNDEKNIYEDDVQKLIAFNMLELADGEDFHFDEQMSRAEFIVTAMKVCGLDAGTSKNQSSGFLDVREDMWYMPYIRAASDLGIIGGNGQQYFYPDEAITVQDAVKIITSAMGYEYLARTKGGYPVGYLMIASELKLLNGITYNSTEALTRGQSAKLFVNALSADVLDVKSVRSDGSMEYDKNNLLISRHSIYMYKGVVTSNSKTSLSSESKLNPGEIEIDNSLICKDAKPAAEDMLGYKVEYAYLLDKEKSINSLLYINKSDNDEMVIHEEDIVSANSQYIEMEDESGKIDKYLISPNAFIIYNGKYIKDFSEGLIWPAQGSVTLIDNGRNGSYNIVLVNAYTNIVVNDKNKDELKFYDKYIQGKNVTLKGDNNKSDIKLYGTDGAEVKFDDVKVGDVLSAYFSQGGECLKIIVSSATQQGTVTEITNEGKIVVGDKSFEYTNEFKTYLDSKNKEINLNQNITLYLDAFGYVAGFENISDNTVKIAYLVNAVLSDNVDKKMTVKLFTSDGTHKIYNCADSVLLDGDNYKNHNKLYQKLMSRAQIISTIVGYKLNPDNEITYLDTPTSGINEGDNTLFMTSSNYTWNNNTGYTKDGNFLTYKNKILCFGFKILVDDSVPIFSIPSKDAATADDKFFDVKHAGDYNNDAQAYFESYQFDKDAILSNALVEYVDTEGGKSIDVNSTLAVVKNISKTLVDGEEVTTITALKDGNEVIIKPNEEGVFHNIPGHSKKNSEGKLYTYNNFQVGDVFRYRTLADGTVGVVQMLLGTVGERTGGVINAKEKEVAYNEESNKYALMRFATRKVYAKSKGYIRLASGDLSAIKEEDQFNLETHKASSYSIMVVDGEGRNVAVRKGNVDDIRDYKTNDSGCSYVLLQTRYGDPKSIVVFNSDTYNIY